MGETGLTGETGETALTRGAALDLADHPRVSAGPRSGVAIAALAAVCAAVGLLPVVSDGTWLAQICAVATFALCWALATRALLMTLASTLVPVAAFGWLWAVSGAGQVTPLLGGAGWFGTAWRDLLAGDLPLPGEPRFVLALSLLTWVATLLAALAGGRGGSPALALAPAATLLAVAGYLSPNSAQMAWAAAGFLAFAALSLLRRPGTAGPGRSAADRPVARDRTPKASPRATAGRLGWLRGPGSRSTGKAASAPSGTSRRGRLADVGRRAGLPTAVLVGALAISVPLSVMIPMPRAAEPAEPFALDLPVASPLAWVAPWQAGVGEPVFQLDEPRPGVALRWATLDRYDGQGWSSSDTFDLAGSHPRIQSSAEPPQGNPVSLTVSDVHLPGPWIPGIGMPESVRSSTALLVAPGTGDLATREPVDAYSVTGIPIRAERAGLETARSEPLDPSRLTPGVRLPSRVRDRAEEVTTTAGSDLERLAMLAGWCRESLTLDPAAVPGQSTETLAAVLDGRPGTMDQLVAGYALMARSLGFPSRVVVGFSADGKQVLSRDVVAWPEVYLRGAGWQPFYPVALAGLETDDDLLSPGPYGAAAGHAGPDRSEDPAAPDRAASDPASSDPASDPAPGAPDAQQAGSPSPGVQPTTPEPRQSPGRVLVPVGAGTGGLLVILLILVLRRRRRLSPEQRVLLAWRRALRSLGRQGISDAGALSGAEIAQAAARLGPQRQEAASRLAALVSGMLYGAQPATVETARAATRLARDVGRSRFRPAPRPGRVTPA
ncbi:MAG: DUF3488 and transglutaminase-like domain-containing protein [Actinomycetales bacterium]